MGWACGHQDVRFAHHPKLLPALQGSFILCSTVPSAWLSARRNAPNIPTNHTLNGASAIMNPHDYPLAVSWDGILVDDPNHSADIIRHVRAVLNCIWSPHLLASPDLPTKLRRLALLPSPMPIHLLEASRDYADTKINLARDRL